MRFLLLTFVFGMLNGISSGPASESSSLNRKIKSFKAHPVATNATEPVATNLILQSKDGGHTWQDISSSLPNNEEPEDFFAGATDLYLRDTYGMYHSKGNLKTPVWEKVMGLDPRCGTIAFNRSGVVAYNFDGLVYREMSGTGSWTPVFTNMKKPTMRTVFEMADGSMLLGFDNGLYKSTDKGQSWKQIEKGGWVIDIVEADGILLATSQKGIIRSADKGETWETVISEGGVGIAIERIDGGFAAISYSTKAESRRIRVSWDGGKTWNAIDGGLSPSPSISSIKQMGSYLFCGHPDGIFRSADMGKTWLMVHESIDKSLANAGIMWNYLKSANQGKVFKLYVSGKVLYAVAKNGGC